MQILIKYYKQTAKESLYTLDLGKGSINDCENHATKPEKSNKKKSHPISHDDV